MGQVKLLHLNFLTILGLVGFEWLEEVDNDEFFFWIHGEQQRGG